MLLERFLFVLVWLIFTINLPLYGAPHNNLVWQDSWCWMDSALQVLASMNPIVETLSQKVSKFTVQEKNDRWEYALHEVLQQITDTKRTAKVNPRKLYNLITGGTIPDFDRFNKAQGCTMSSSHFMNDMLKALVDPASNGLLQDIDSRLRVMPAPEITEHDQDGWNYCIRGSKMWNYLVNTLKFNKTNFAWEKFLNNFPFPKIAEYFQLSFEDDYAPFRLLGVIKESSWGKFPAVQGELPENFINFTTKKTINAKEKSYHCYAILLGLTGHATALIEDNESPGTWYYYDDDATDKRLKGLSVPKDKVDQVARLNIKYDEKLVMALFYKAEVKAEANPLSIKLENLKQKLVDLSSKLQVLKKNLGALKQSLKI